ncbi:MAG TPA: YciI family protein [Lysobacter sp.]
MRYLMMIKEAGQPPPPELMAGMAALTAEMAQAGVLLSAEGLTPSAQGMRLSYSDGRRTVVDGPFAEAKELVGGFAILRADSREQALALAQRVLDVHIAAGVEEFAMEIRPLYEPALRADGAATDKPAQAQATTG